MWCLLISPKLKMEELRYLFVTEGQKRLIRQKNLKVARLGKNLRGRKTRIKKNYCFFLSSKLFFINGIRHTKNEEGK